MKPYRVIPDTKVNLSKWNPNQTPGFNGNKEDAQAEIAKLTQKLGELQEVLFAEHKHKVLIVLQAMDTGGKDGTIRHIFFGINPAGVRVASFKTPTEVLVVPRPGHLFNAGEDARRTENEIPLVRRKPGWRDRGIEKSDDRHTYFFCRIWGRLGCSQSLRLRRRRWRGKSWRVDR